MIKLWRCFALKCWHLTPRQAETWWLALQGAKYSESAAWYQALMAFERRPLWEQKVGDVTAFLEAEASPQRVLYILEALVHEKRLLRRDAVSIENKILEQVRSDGQYR